MKKQHAMFVHSSNAPKRPDDEAGTAADVNKYLEAGWRVAMATQPVIQGGQCVCFVVLEKDG